MMKRDVNNSRGNLEGNVSSIASNKSRNNVSLTNAVINQPKQPVLPIAQTKFATQPQLTPQQNFLETQTQIFAQQQQISMLNGNNYLSQTNTMSVMSTKANPQNEQFQSYQQNPMINTRVMTNQGRDQMFISSQDIDLSIYPGPHPISPTGKYLSKLLPPNEQTIKFFNEYFSEHGERITNELTAHAKMIFGAILKSVM